MDKLQKDLLVYFLMLLIWGGEIYLSISIGEKIQFASSLAATTKSSFIAVNIIFIFAHYLKKLIKWEWIIYKFWTIYILISPRLILFRPRLILLRALNNKIARSLL